MLKLGVGPAGGWLAAGALPSIRHRVQQGLVGLSLMLCESVIAESYYLPVQSVVRWFL